MSLDLGETILQLDRVTRNLGRDYPDRRNQLTQLLRDAAAVTPAEARNKTERFLRPLPGRPGDGHPAGGNIAPAGALRLVGRLGGRLPH